MRGKVVLVHVFIAYMHSVIALHLHIHTFTYTYIITSFHNQLKTVHLNGKVNRRVDFFTTPLDETREGYVLQLQEGPSAITSYGRQNEERPQLS